MDDVRELFIDGIESQNLSIFVEELLLGLHFSSSKRVFKIVKQLFILNWNVFNLTLFKLISWEGFISGLGDSNVSIEFSSVLIN